MHVKSSGLLSADQQTERERRLAMAVGRLPSFSAAASEPSYAVSAPPELLVAGSPTQVLDPRLIVRSRWANRHPSNFSGDAFAQLREEIRQAGGNVQPIKIRPLPSPGTPAQPGEVAPRYEIVFGHRRHEACLLEGLPVLAMVADLDDRTLFIEMDRENRVRKDLTAWEQGVMYRRALDTGLFPVQARAGRCAGRRPQRPDQGGHAGRSAAGGAGRVSFTTRSAVPVGPATGRGTGGRSGGGAGPGWTTERPVGADVGQARLRTVDRACGCRKHRRCAKP